MNKKGFIGIIILLAGVILIFTACSGKKASPALKEQKFPISPVINSTVDNHSEMEKSKQEFTIPPEIKPSQYLKAISGFNDSPCIRLWGWSNNGKVSYSIETGQDARGGVIIEFVVLDLVSDKTIFNLTMDSFDHDDVEVKALYNLYRVRISDALKAHNITRAKTEFSKFPIKKNNTGYNCQIVNAEYKKDEYEFFEKVVSKYEVLVTADNKKKIISNSKPISSTTGYVYVCGYFLSPFENIALVVVAERRRGFEGTELVYRFHGCNLETGFK